MITFFRFKFSVFDFRQRELKMCMWLDYANTSTFTSKQLRNSNYYIENLMFMYKKWHLGGNRRIWSFLLKKKHF